MMLMLTNGYRRIPAYRRKIPLHVSIDNKFTDDQRVDIIQAILDWNYASNNRLFDFSDTPDTYIICEPTQVGGWTSIDAIYNKNGQWSVRNSTTYISVLMDSDALYNTVLHELGHVLGLDHALESDVMSYMLVMDTKGQAASVDRIHITNDDIRGLGY